MGVGRRAVLMRKGRMRKKKEDERAEISDLHCNSVAQLNQMVEYKRDVLVDREACQASTQFQFWIFLFYDLSKSRLDGHSFVEYLQN